MAENQTTPATAAPPVNPAHITHAALAAAVVTLEAAGWTYSGGPFWTPPEGKR